MPDIIVIKKDKYQITDIMEVVYCEKIKILKEIAKITELDYIKIKEKYLID